ncbi:MAG TPA: hypothetical protein VFB63_12530 [Bryobacteraceae bacterium]|nr:hypothetical protein [Bryobacteraceae bacterium]
MTKMNIGAALVMVLLYATVAPAQKRAKVDINAETPEGQALQAIGQEADPAKKLAQMEEFLQKHPSHPGALWVLGQAEAAYAKAGQHDKVLATVPKILAADPADVEMAHQALKSAEAKNDTALVVEWSQKTREAAKAAEKTPKPADEDQVESWKHTVDFAQQVQKYCDYSLYAQALKTTDPAGKILAGEALAQASPQSEYLPQLNETLFVAYRQANQAPKAVALGEKLLAANKANEDVLLVMIDQYARNKEAAKVEQTAQAMVEMMKTKPVPAGVDPAAWEKKKTTVMGIGMHVLGVSYSNAGKAAQADKALREALPLLTDEQMKAEALFHLGLSNYKMGSGAKDGSKLILEAMRFNQMCAAIKSPWQAQANKNIAAIRTQYRMK